MARPRRCAEHLASDVRSGRPGEISQKSARCWIYHVKTTIQLTFAKCHHRALWHLVLGLPYPSLLIPSRAPTWHRPPSRQPASNRMCVGACGCGCGCVCVRARARESERVRDKERERARESANLATLLRPTCIQQRVRWGGGRGGERDRKKKNLAPSSPTPTCIQQRVYGAVCVCVCVRARENKRERKRKKQCFNLAPSSPTPTCLQQCVCSGRGWREGTRESKRENETESTKQRE